MLPAMRTTEPNSPTARAKLIAAPERIAGTRFGSTMRRKIVRSPAPSDAAASSISRSSSMTTGWTERTTNGSVTKSSASMIAVFVAMTLTPSGEVGPHSASSTMPTTIVGSANARSISALMTPLPRKRSRTSTHATSVPVTALIAATASEHPSVSLSAATAWRLVTADQNASSPPSVERASSAASGTRTMTLSQSVASPNPSAPGPPTTAPRSPRRRTAAPVRASLGSGHPRVLLDLRHRARVGVEELVVDLRPAAEVADREQPLRRREPRGRLPGHRRVHGAVAPRGEGALRRRRDRVARERLGLRAMGRLRDDRDRVLDQDRLSGDDVIDLLALPAGRERLVLVGDQHVAGPRREVLQRLAAGLVLYDDVLGEQLAQVVEAGLRVLAAAALRAVRGEDVPLRRAGGERVRRQHLDARPEQVVPAADVLRVA